MGDVRHALFDAGFSAFSLTRANRWLRPLAQGRGLILALHRVRPPQGRDAFAPNRFLEITPQFLERAIDAFEAAGFEFLSLDAVPERLSRMAGERPFVVFTFDDGYRDNLLHAWPILQRRKVPWTVFLVPDFLDGKGVLWWLDLEDLIVRSDRVELAVRDEVVRLPAGSGKEKSAAFATIAARLMHATRQDLDAVSASIAEQLGRDRDHACREACADWSEIARLASDPSVTIGAHSCSHPILSRLDDLETWHELRDSRRLLERRLARPIRHFAYPHGGPGEAGRREYGLARDAGYQSAVTTRPDHLRREHAARPHALPRISLNGLHQTDHALEAMISGVPFLLQRLMRQGSPGGD